MTKHPTICITIDTREQQPLDFAGLDCTTRVATVQVFDYALDGDEARFAVERKSVEDFIGSVTTTDGWRLERAKIEKARALGMTPIVYVVEGRMLDLLPIKKCLCNPTTLACPACKGRGTVGYNYDRRAPSVTSQFCFHQTFEMLYDLGVSVVFADGRTVAACVIEGVLRRRFEALEKEKDNHE